MATKTEQQWQAELSADDYRICRLKGTEPAFSGIYESCKTSGIYHCKCCNKALFESSTKYDSGSGWPSFWAAINEQHIKQIHDNSHGMLRVEVVCAHCDCHLGHLFEDGPQPTGLRYCINSASLTLNSKE
ncbi:peptide-methionine (R)-S-oxide reductase [Cycloclasticus sp. 46_120_T64]|nr:peptide-methionine (R)-S-oxide reductase [Cycloclasticus sp. 46_120_T64]